MPRSSALTETTRNLWFWRRIDFLLICGTTGAHATGTRGGNRTNPPTGRGVPPLRSILTNYEAKCPFVRRPRRHEAPESCGGPRVARRECRRPTPDAARTRQGAGLSCHKAILKWKINDETPNTSQMCAKHPTSPRKNHTDSPPSPPWAVESDARAGTARRLGYNCRGISRRAAVYSSPSSWYPVFGLRLLTQSWELGKGSVHLVEHETTPLFRNSRFLAATRPRTRVFCRVA